MSQIIQKLAVGEIRSLFKNSNKITIKFIRVLSDEQKNANNKGNQRPMYAPEEATKIEYDAENPVSSNSSVDVSVLSTVNPECDPDDPNCVSYNTNQLNFNVANPELPLENQDNDSSRAEVSQATLDNPPTTCCMSGCSNCVYIIWAEALSKQMATADPEVAKKILDSVEDPSMKSFLQMELRSLGIIK